MKKIGIGILLLMAVLYVYLWDELPPFRAAKQIDKKFKIEIPYLTPLESKSSLGIERHIFSISKELSDAIKLDDRLIRKSVYIEFGFQSQGPEIQKELLCIDIKEEFGKYILCLDDETLKLYYASYGIF